MSAAVEPPPIQYAKTSDGVNIAYWTLGRGMPLVLNAPNGGGFSHVTLEWQLPALREWYELLAQRHLLVRYDPRNSGLSDRGVEEITLDAYARDLEAVVDRLELGQFDLLGFMVHGMTAIAYETSHPGRVRRLVLASTGATFAGFFSGERQAAIASLREKDFQLYLENFARSVLGWNPEAHELAKFYAQCVTQEDSVRANAPDSHYYVADLLPHVTAPTLVIHHPGSRLDRLYLPGQARELAAGIPNAQLAAIPIDASIWYASPRVREAIERFLSDEETPAAPLQGPAARQGTAVILFADIADSSALTEQLGDATFRERSRTLDTALRNEIAHARGAAVEGKVMGDGVMAVFASASEAIACAIACEVAGRDVGLALHLGIHAGDVIHEPDNVYGGAVNVAARIADICSPGDVLVSATVRDLARTSAGVAFEDRGDHHLKGIGEPVRLYAVRPERE